MSEINPNTPVTESSKPAGPNSDEFLTFDELEAASGGKNKSRQAKEAEELEKKVNVPKAEPKGDDDLQDEPEKKAKEPKEPKEPKEAKVEKAGKEKEQKELEKQAKKYKAKLADKELDLDEETMVPVKINGKEEFIPVKELLSNYSGKVAWDKKFTEVDKIRQQAMTEKKSVDMSRSQIKSIFEEKDPTLRLFKMAELAGVTPAEFRQSYLDESQKHLEKWQSMSEAERKADALEFENKYLRYQQETKDKSLQAQQAVQDLDKKVEHLLATHSLDKREFVAYHDQMAELVKQGHLKLGPDGLTPESITEYMVKDKFWAKADEAISELGIKMDDKAKTDRLMLLVNTAFEHNIGLDEIPEIISELWGDKKAQKVLSEKVKEQKEFKEGKKPALNHKPSEAVLFEDIM